MKISEIYNLQVSQHELDFVDVDLDTDCHLYIDPFLIANSKSQWCIQVDMIIKSFFNEFKTAMLKEDYEKAKELFLFMEEPKENCLGVSKKGTTNGKGVGKLNTQKIVDKIIESNAIEDNLVNNIEDIIIFVEDIDRDKLSDMVTNIIREKLIEYTKIQCNLWGIQMQRQETKPFWDATARRWVYSEEDLLITNNREILLIPKAIVSPIKLYEASQYKWFHIVEQERMFHLQRRSSLVKLKTLKNGSKKYYLPKKDVHNDIRNQILRGEYLNTKDYIRKYTQRYPELFCKFIDKCKVNVNSLTSDLIADQIDNYDVNLVIENLIERLKNIPVGREYASEFHHYVKSLLEIIFYPYLINPIIEREIHNGRKRIDIIMDNNAKDNFFFNLHNINKIFCPYIYIECKNYGKDVANPEIDQLSGRFSSSRGQFGILICRALKDADLFIKRCNDTYSDGRGLVLYLTDEDIINMLQAIKEDQYSKIWTMLEDKKRKIVLG
ncbi:MAG TPA: hypothetical protein DEF42_15880 [Desulfosporosinus sp.]|nr:hypothetical protein [Desulfosporosinus sp.]